MKKIALNFIALGLGALAFTACDDAKNDVIDNLVYISEGTGSSPVEEIVMNNTDQVYTSTFTVSMSKPAVTDTKITLTLDPATLDNYNRRNGTEFAVIPAEYVSYPAEVVIQAGMSAVTVPVEFTSFEGEKGVDYAAPFCIKDAQGEIISGGAKSLIYTFGKPLTQMAPGFYHSNEMSIPFPEGGVELPNFTVEWWCRVTNSSGTGGFSINNQAIFAFNANYELYVRFGDITYGYGNYNFLQIKAMGVDANYDSGDPAKNPLKWGEWMHFAHTYDAATGKCTLYMNGKEVNTCNGGAGNVHTFTGCTMFGSDMQRDKIEMAQLRMWKTTRTEAQIQKFMKKSVKYTDPNLLFYIPMDEGQGSTLQDVTGNGYDLTVPNSDAVSWNEYTWE